MQNKKSVLIINRSAPYGSSHAKESIDVALTCGIFEMPVSLLFMDQGIYQLLKQQDGKRVDQKNLTSVLSSLPMYDIENLYVARTALEENHIELDEMCLPVKALNADEIKTLIHQHDTVLSF